MIFKTRKRWSFSRKRRGNSGKRLRKSRKVKTGKVSEAKIKRGKICVRYDWSQTWLAKKTTPPLRLVKDMLSTSHAFCKTTALLSKGRFTIYKKIPKISVWNFVQKECVLFEVSPKNRPFRKSRKMQNNLVPSVSPSPPGGGERELNFRPGNEVGCKNDKKELEFPFRTSQPGK